MTTTIKSTLIYFGAALIAFFSPIIYAFIFTCILVGIDTITGVMKAGKDSVQNISSKKAFAIVPKLIFYFLLVICAHACEVFVDDQLPLVKLALIGIGWIEIKSIDENFAILFGFSFLDRTIEAVKNVNKITRR